MHIKVLSVYFQILTILQGAWHTHVLTYKNLYESYNSTGNKFTKEMRKLLKFMPTLKSSSDSVIKAWLAKAGSTSLTFVKSPCQLNNTLNIREK